jgi:hypothetical protein
LPPHTNNNVKGTQEKSYKGCDYNATYLLDVHHVVMTTRDCNPPSQVLSGTLWLEGVLIPRAILDFQRNGRILTLRRKRNIESAFNLYQLEYIFRMEFDVSTYGSEFRSCLNLISSSSSEFVCMPCQHSSHLTPIDRHNFTEGLLLRRTGNVNAQYERLGIFRFRWEAKNWKSENSTSGDSTSIQYFYI